MNLLNLLWIIPLSVGLGLFLAALLNANKEHNNDRD